MITMCCICSWIRRSRSFAAGSKWEYSNSGYTLLGLIVEQVAQKPFHDFMKSEIFTPLGMDESVMYQRGLNEVPHRAFGHDEERWQVGAIGSESDECGTRRRRGVHVVTRLSRNGWRESMSRSCSQKSSYEAMFSPQVLTDPQR